MELQGSLDDEIEVNFSISPSIRRLRYHDPDQVHMREDLGVMYITPSIAENDFHRWLLKSHFFDALIGAKETRMLEFEARRGWNNLFAPAVHALTYIVARDDGPSEVHLELFDGQLLPDQVEMKAGPVRVSVRNNMDVKMPVCVGFLGDDNDTHPEPTFRIERFLTGKRLLTNQTFRRLFKAETIEVGTGLQIKSLAVLFTDLQASTAMYERVGDLKALDIVRRHFTVLESVVAAQQGAVVKTIGDAVMAVFPEPDQAVAAAAEMIANVRQAAAHGEDLVLKTGVHCGPCVAIQSNNQVDYFGRTVNIASRVQALAEGGQIVCTEEVWNQPGVQDVVAGRGFSFRREQPLLKGIADRFPVRRIVVAVAPPAAQGRRGAPRTSQIRTAARRGTARGVARPAQHSGTRGKRAARRRP